MTFQDFYPELSVAVKIANYFIRSIHDLMGLTDDCNNEETNKLSFINTLKKLKKENNLSIEKFSKTTNMSEANFYRWQSGKSRPAMNSLIAIAQFFDVTIDYLIGRC